MNKIVATPRLLCLAALIAGVTLHLARANAETAREANSQPPKEIHSTKFGTLKLQEVKVPGFSAFFYNGTCRDPQRGSVRIVFHPPKGDPAKWLASIPDAEKRAGDLLGSERAILRTGTDEFSRLFRRYQIDAKSIDQPYPDLKLSVLKLVSDGDDELVYAPCKWFPSFNLTVSISCEYRVTHANFDG